jgi:hypothetical protein
MRTPHERGNVLFYVLIGITLLAALIYAVSQSGRGSVQQVNIEKAKLLATEMIEYTNAVSTAFAQLRLRGCKLEQMSFENAVDLGYVNASAPGDKTCNIFDLAGGGITFKNPPPEASDGASRQLFTIELVINEVGSTCIGESCTDLAMYSGPLSLPVCMELNEKLNVPNPAGAPPADEAELNSAEKYDGAISQESMIGENSGGGDVTLKGKTAACFQDTNDNKYYFYKVLQAR